jgi:hypothetical protein
MACSLSFTLGIGGSSWIADASTAFGKPVIGLGWIAMQ